MSFKDDPTDSDWKVEKRRSTRVNRNDRSSSSQEKQKYAQRFCEKWLRLFDPWLARCEDDPNKPFCKACQCRLDCNRCHLQRHERTTKHARNLVILINKGEFAARQNLSIRQERSKYYQQRKMNSSSELKNDNSELSANAEDEFVDDEELESTDKPELSNDNDNVNNSGQDLEFAPNESTISDQFNEEPVLKQEVIITDDNFSLNLGKHSTPKSSGIVNNGRVLLARRAVPLRDITSKQSTQKDRMKLLLQIQKNKSDLVESYQALLGGNVSLQQSPPKERNHVDLFFDSVSSSVKALSPKLIAEAKMRVSQLICELELRALTEQDPNTQCGSATTSVVMTTEANSSTPAATYIINESNNIMLHDQTIGQAHHYDALS